MKINISSVSAAFGIAAALLASSCNMNVKSITGSGNVITQNRNVSGEFYQLEVKNGIDVVIIQSDNTAITVEADDNLMEHIHTEISGNTLKITSDFNQYNNVSSKKVILKMPKITSIEGSSGADITTTASVKGEKLKVNASSGTEIKLQLEVENIVCDASSGSKIRISGKALELETSTSSGSEIDCSGLLANEVTSKASSGSSTEVHPIVSLDAEASSGGSISYAGDPKEIVKDVSSGGSVSAK
ncbi:MAG: DUF2807 domain-containing protein [Flavobacterium sp.]|nr:MAG: DUF2807 domain-containing protein [Flavobacterium sp.]